MNAVPPVEDRHALIRRLREERREADEEAYERERHFKLRRAEDEQRDERKEKYSAAAHHLLFYTALLVMTIVLVYMVAEYIRSQSAKFIAALPFGTVPDTPNGIGVTRTSATTWASVHLGAILLLVILTGGGNNTTAKEPSGVLSSVVGFFFTPVKMIGNKVNEGVLQPLLVLILTILSVCGLLFYVFSLYDGANEGVLIALCVVSVFALLRIVYKEHKKMEDETDKNLRKASIFENLLRKLENHLKTNMERTGKVDEEQAYNQVDVLGQLLQDRKDIVDKITDLTDVINNLKDDERLHTYETAVLGKLYESATTLIQKGDEYNTKASSRWWRRVWSAFSKTVDHIGNATGPQIEEHQ